MFSVEHYDLLPPTAHPIIDTHDGRKITLIMVEIIWKLPHIPDTFHLAWSKRGNIDGHESFMLLGSREITQRNDLVFTFEANILQISSSHPDSDPWTISGLEVHYESLNGEETGCTYIDVTEAEKFLNGIWNQLTPCFSHADTALPVVVRQYTRVIPCEFETLVYARKAEISSHGIEMKL